MSEKSNWANVKRIGENVKIQELIQRTEIEKNTHVRVLYCKAGTHHYFYSWLG